MDSIKNAITATSEFFTGFLKGGLGPYVLIIAAIAIAVYEVGKAFGWWTDVSSMIDAITAGLKRLWRAFIHNPNVVGTIKTIGGLFNWLGEQLGPVGREAEAMDLEMYGFEYKVTPKLEKSRGYSLEKDLRDLAYTLGVLIEGKNMSVLLENAKAPKVPAADLNGNWASADLKDIQADIIEMQDAYDQTDYQYDLNGLFYNRREYKALRKHMNNSVEKYDIKHILCYNKQL